MLEVRLLHIDTKNNSRALEQTVERLKEVERLKNGFLSTASHELRTPLTSIRGSLGLLASGVVGALSDEAVEVVAIAERNAVRLMALISDILDLERLETGTIELRFAQVPVESILRRAMESLPAFGHQPGITVEVPEVSATIWADADRIVQVVVNLLSNAVKFSPPGGVVTIGVGLRDSWVEFRITDRGRGVPVAFRRAIFRTISPGGDVRRARKGRHRPGAGHLQVDRRAAWRHDRRRERGRKRQHLLVPSRDVARAGRAAARTRGSRDNGDRRGFEV
jgi:signal transduction histidine kinase